MTLQDRIEAMVRLFIEGAGWSPRQLSIAAGIGPGRASDVLAGRGCTVATAEALAAVIRREAPGTDAALLATWTLSTRIGAPTPCRPERKRNKAQKG